MTSTDLRSREQTGGLPASIDDIIENFEILDEVDDRYRYLIELGRMLPPLPEEARSEANRVRGCVSQVWLATRTEPGFDGKPLIHFAGDSDALITKGIVAILLVFFSGLPAEEILSRDALALFSRLNLSEHLTPQRSNGARAMVERMKADARASLG